MREKIDTVPLTEAFSSGDECPLCYLERQAEQRTIRYVLGSGASYMEPEVRGATDAAGFCRGHYEKMYTYGNKLGNALILQTYMAGLLEEFTRLREEFTMPDKRPLLGKRKDGPPELLTWARKKNSTCYICSRTRENMDRYYATFFAMIRDPDFRTLVENSKGFCMHHFTQLMEHAREELPNAQREWFYPAVLKLMEDNLYRMKEDLDWFVRKHDYTMAGQPWKNSADAVPRAMQKMKGGHPADKPYTTDF